MKYKISNVISNLPPRKYIRELPGAYQVVFTFEGRREKPLTKCFSFNGHGGKRKALMHAKTHRRNMIMRHPALQDMRNWMQVNGNEGVRTKSRKAFVTSQTGVRDVTPSVQDKGAGIVSVVMIAKHRLSMGISQKAKQYNVLWYGWKGAFQEAVKTEAYFRGCTGEIKMPPTPSPKGKILAALERLQKSGFLDEKFNPTQIAKKYESKVRSRAVAYS